MICLVNDHQDEFSKLIDDVRKRQRGKRNKPVTKTTGKKEDGSCFMNHTSCNLSNQLESIFTCPCTLII